MLALKSEPTSGEEALLASFDSASIQAELDLLEHLNFSFDMDKDQPNPRPPSGSTSRAGASNRARSVSTPGPAGNASASTSRAATQTPGAPPPGWVPPNAPFPFPLPNSPEGYEAIARALRTLQDAYPYLPPPPGFQDPRYAPQIPPELYSQFPWPPQQLPQLPAQAPPYNTSFPPFNYSVGGQYPSAQLPNINTQLPPMPSALTASGSASGSTYGQDTSPVDDANISEEKRRRNTAASARFRVKKKQKALNLERTVSDLTGRVDELEQEAADLRRENGWLKEIVMLRSTRTVGGPSAGPSDTAKDDEKDDEADEGGDGGEEDKPKEK